MLEAKERPGYLVLGSDADAGKEFGVITAERVEPDVVRHVYEAVFQAIYSETQPMQDGLLYAPLREAGWALLAAVIVTESEEGRQGLELRGLVLPPRMLEAVDWNPFRLSQVHWNWLVKGAASCLLSRAEVVSRVRKSAECEATVRALATRVPRLQDRPDEVHRVAGGVDLMAAAFAELEQARSDVLLQIPGFCTSWPDDNPELPSFFRLCWRSTGVPLEGRKSVPVQAVSPPEAPHPPGAVSNAVLYAAIVRLQQQVEAATCRGGECARLAQGPPDGEPSRWPAPARPGHDLQSATGDEAEIETEGPTRGLRFAPAWLKGRWRELAWMSAFVVTWVLGAWYGVALTVAEQPVTENALVGSHVRRPVLLAAKKPATSAHLAAKKPAAPAPAAAKSPAPPVPAAAKKPAALIPLAAGKARP